MKRILLPGIAAIGVGLAVLAACLVLTAGSEAGGIYHDQGFSVDASFYSEEGTVATEVYLYAADYSSQSPPGRPHKGSNANIWIFQHDLSTGEVLLDASGWADLPDQAFQINKKLNSASLDATIEVCSWVGPWPTPTPTPEYCDPVFPTTFTGTVTVDGEPPPDGTLISAIGSDGLTWATTTTVSGSYDMVVPETMPVTSPCFPGGTISFQCDGVPAAETGEATGGLQELNLTCGPLVPTTPTPPPTPVPPECFAVDVDIAWVGAGPLTRQSNHWHDHSPDFKDNGHCSGSFRAATASGNVFDGVVNFTPDPALWAEMWAFKCGGVTIG